MNIETSSENEEHNQCLQTEIDDSPAFNDKFRFEIDDED